MVNVDVKASSNTLLSSLPTTLGKPVLSRAPLPVESRVLS